MFLLMFLSIQHFSLWTMKNAVQLWCKQYLSCFPNLSRSVTENAAGAWSDSLSTSLFQRTKAFFFFVCHRFFVCSLDLVHRHRSFLNSMLEIVAVYLFMCDIGMFFCCNCWSRSSRGGWWGPSEPLDNLYQTKGSHATDWKQMHVKQPWDKLAEPLSQLQQKPKIFITSLLHWHLLFMLARYPVTRSGM